MNFWHPVKIVMTIIVLDEFYWQHLLVYYQLSDVLDLHNFWVQGSQKENLVMVASFTTVASFLCMNM